MRFNSTWEEELMFVASEPFEDFIALTVIDRVPGKDENLGMVFIRLREIPQRMHESTKPLDPRWFNLQKPFVAAEEETEKKK
jgi:hypothetical protein